MMKFWRFTPLVALTAAVLLLAAAIVIVIVAERGYRELAIRDATVDARILARVMAAPLAFGDINTAATYFDALEANAGIVAAAVYDERGQQFAAFVRKGAAELPGSVQAGDVAYGGGRVEVAVPVVQNELLLGTVYLRAVTESLGQRLARYSGVVLLGVMMLIVLAVLGVAQATVNRANAELQRRAKALELANARLLEQITHRKKAEEALRQAQKMESIGQLTGGVAHDFNNLLAIILGNLERMGRQIAQGAGPERLQQALVNAKTGAERAATLTRSLLAFSRRQALQPQPVHVNRLVAGMSELLRRTLGEQVIIESVVAGGLWRTNVDPNQLEIAILNLSVNARDAMPDGGKLTIETANAYLDGRYTDEYEGLEPGQYVLLSITDTGIGMGPEAVDRAFEPFFTTKDVGHGTGLGLSQVYGLVKQSGGHIKIYSEPGEGTTVKVYLPRLLSDEEPAATAPPVLSMDASAAAATAMESVLVVEDNDGMREHSAAVLAELGYTVFEAADGVQALQALDKHPDIALLFTDVGLPGGMNGRQLAEEGQRRRPGLRVLYTTGYARNAIVHEGRLDPDVRLVTKPFTYDELARAVRQVLDAKEPEILVVEDEFLVMMNTVDGLTELGCRAIEAGTAADARTMLAQRAAGGLAAVVVDLNLPDLRGDGLVAEIRERWPALPVVIASGFGADRVRRQLAEDPMVGLLPKPFDIGQLEAVLRKAGVPVRRRDG